MKSSHTNKIKALLLVCFCYAGAVRSQTYPLEASGSASPCQIDVKCSEGSSLSIQKDAVNLYYHMDSYLQKSTWGGTCFLINDASSIPNRLNIRAQAEAVPSPPPLILVRSVKVIQKPFGWEYPMCIPLSTIAAFP